jgi:hypothetical protein
MACLVGSSSRRRHPRLRLGHAWLQSSVERQAWTWMNWQASWGEVLTPWAASFNGGDCFGRGGLRSQAIVRPPGLTSS